MINKPFEKEQFRVARVQIDVGENSPFAEMDFEIVNYLDFLPHSRAKSGSLLTCFAHLRAGRKITPSKWGLNRVLELFLKPKWGKEFIFAS